MFKKQKAKLSIVIIFKTNLFDFENFWQLVIGFLYFCNKQQKNKVFCLYF